MKKLWKISIPILLILVIALGFLYRDTLKERLGSLTVQETDLSHLTYDRLSLGHQFKPDSSYVKQEGDTAKLNDYNHRGMNAFYVTTTANNTIVGLKLLDKAPRCRSYFDNGLAMGMTLTKVKQLLGPHYITFNTDRYGKVAMYIDRKHNNKLLLGLSNHDNVTAIIGFNKSQYDYQY
ncbi:hypothetical protein [Lactiplantibacillus paraxiangfangensis]|uniref:hypothetical protein n=1 Tax=Lactiplantibacillus paraxiangfangensis TaxID=3076224 RepID=UPI0030C734ED